MVLMWFLMWVAFDMEFNMSLIGFWSDFWCGWFLTCILTWVWDVFDTIFYFGFYYDSQCRDLCDCECRDVYDFECRDLLSRRHVETELNPRGAPEVRSYVQFNDEAPRTKVSQDDDDDSDVVASKLDLCWRSWVWSMTAGQIGKTNDETFWQV